MKRSTPGKWIAAVGAVLTVTAAPIQKARALDYEDLFIPIAVGVLIAPGDIGVALPPDDAGSSRFVVGWSWQIPIPIDPTWSSEAALRHRIIPSVDLLLGDGGARWRGRFGYRYARRALFGGAGVGIDGATLTLSPELGVKFAHGGGSHEDIDPSLHLLARADVALESGHLQGVTILFGWNLL